MQSAAGAEDWPATVTLFLCGDVMTGRGIDQIQGSSVAPELHEPYVKNAMDYVRLAETKNGTIDCPVGSDYIWGDALAVWDAFEPALRFINLETSVTTSNDFWPSKGIHYRMHPDNVACLEAARIDGCTLANNHVLDLGRAGLEETLATLEGASIAISGAGANERAAAAPACLALAGTRRVQFFGFCHGSSGVPRSWAATAERAGVNLLPDLGPRTSAEVAHRMLAQRQSGDVVVASIHWGGNWGYEVPKEQQAFARALIDGGAADIVHGHSSHHPKGIETYRGKLILYGCGDFLNDYEGIGGYETFRSWLSVMYFITVDPATGNTADLTMVPMQMQRLRLVHADGDDRRWLERRLADASRPFSTRIGRRGEHLVLNLP